MDWPPDLPDEIGAAVERWYEAALHDLELVEALIEGGFYPEACFHSQQAAEKAIKAFLRARGRVAWGHRIEQLLRRAVDEGLSAADLLTGDELARVKLLSDQYLAPRYPDFRERAGMRLEDYTKEFAASCAELARDIVRRVEAWLRGEGWI